MYILYYKYKPSTQTPMYGSPSHKFPCVLCITNTSPLHTISCSCCSFLRWASRSIFHIHHYYISRYICIYTYLRVYIYILAVRWASRSVFLTSVFLPSIFLTSVFVESVFLPSLFIKSPNHSRCILSICIPYVCLPLSLRFRFSIFHPVWHTLTLPWTLRRATSRSIEGCNLKEA